MLEKFLAMLAHSTCSPLNRSTCENDEPLLVSLVAVMEDSNMVAVAVVVAVVVAVFVRRALVDGYSPRSC